MSSLDAPSAAEVLHKKEMVRLHELWKETKEEVKRKEKDLRLQQQRHEEELQQKERGFSKRTMDLQNSVTELKDKLRFTEIQLSTARSEKSRLESALAESARQIEELQDRLLREQDNNRKTSERAAELGDRVKDMELELDAREEKVAALEADVGAHDDQISFHRMKNAENLKKLTQLQMKLDRQELLNRELTEFVKDSADKSTDVRQVKTALKVMQSDLNILKVNNARLMKLLSSTSEFKGMFQETEHGHLRLMYMPPASATKPGAGAHAVVLKQLYEELRALSGAPGSAQVLENDRPVVCKRETDYWIPPDAYHIINDFKHKHFPHVPVAVFSDLLVDLNRVWKRREERRLSRQKTVMKKEISSLKKEARKKTPPFDEKLQTEHVEFLKKELKKVARSHAANVGSRNQIVAADERVLQATASCMEQLLEQLCAYKAQSDSLVERVHELKVARDRGQSYRRGVRWVASQALPLFERLSEKIRTSMGEFRSVLSRAPSDDAESLYTICSTAHRRLAEDVERTVKAHGTKLQDLVEGELEPGGARSGTEGEEEYESSPSDEAEKGREDGWSSDFAGNAD